MSIFRHSDIFLESSKIFSHHHENQNIAIFQSVVTMKYFLVVFIILVQFIQTNFIYFFVLSLEARLAISNLPRIH